MNINNYDPIADLYDTYVPATFDSPFYVNETRKTSGEVLELMSGTGGVSIPLLESGVRLTCVDISGEQNAILEDKLEQNGKTATVYQMDVCELDLPKKFDLAKAAGFKVQSLYGDYSYAEFHPDTSPFMIWSFITKEK